MIPITSKQVLSRLVAPAIALWLGAVLLSGCGAKAVGPAFSDASLPDLKPEDARLFIYREPRRSGSAVTPHIYLNDDLVGEAVSGGSFHLDIPAGSHRLTASVSTIERILVDDPWLSLTVKPGDTRFVEIIMYPGPTVGVYIPRLTLVDRTQASQILKETRYTGPRTDQNSNTTSR